uniref:Transthyretin-like protein 2 n=1 Tax=Meloidogyne javanica TaxID=6303 RepID=A0A0K1TQL7_MELJA|nr:transthyretin-like protein 2 [Meloidogyne javanica]
MRYFATIISFLLIIFIFTLFSTFCSAEQQNITIRGQAICRRRSVKGLHVELRERDTFDPDDSLGTTTTGPDGTFEVSGGENEIGSIRPYLRIIHKCDVTDDIKCRRTTEIDIQKDKVNGIYEMNFVNLNLPGHRDNENCDD